MDTKSTFAEANAQNRKTVGQAQSPNTTTSYASQEAKPDASASASNPSHAEASYAAPNPELSYLFATTNYTLATSKRGSHSKTFPFRSTRMDKTAIPEISLIYSTRLIITV